jgi:hypothetical protein
MFFFTTFRRSEVQILMSIKFIFFFISMPDSNPDEGSEPNPKLMPKSGPNPKLMPDPGPKKLI